MSLIYEQTIDNQNVVQLERRNEIRELLTESRDTTPSPEVQEILRHMALAEIIS
jgi:hypothetical protein